MPLPNGIELSISNPENEALTVVVDIDVELTGEGCVWMPGLSLSRITFDLPAGQNAGKNVVRMLLFP